MYEEIYALIKSAVWGADFVLNANQAFILDEISTIFCLLAVFAPAIIIIGICKRLFRW